MNPTADDAKELLINPYGAIVFNDYLWEDDFETDIAKEDWVQANIELMKELEPKEWLGNLLFFLSHDKLEDDASYLTPNPRHAIAISDNFRGDHTPIISRKQWVTANLKLMQEIGADEWLWRLLRILESGGTVELDPS